MSSNGKGIEMKGVAKKGTIKNLIFIPCIKKRETTDLRRLSSRNRLIGKNKLVIGNTKAVKGFVELTAGATEIQTFKCKCFFSEGLTVC